MLPPTNNTINTLLRCSFTGFFVRNTTYSIANNRLNQAKKVENDVPCLHMCVQHMCSLSLSLSLHKHIQNYDILAFICLLLFFFRYNSFASINFQWFLSPPSLLPPPPSTSSSSSSVNTNQLEYEMCTQSGVFLQKHKDTHERHCYIAFATDAASGVLGFARSNENPG